MKHDAFDAGYDQSPPLEGTAVDTGSAAVEESESELTANPAGDDSGGETRE